jgi:hypothetical protein
MDNQITERRGREERWRGGVERRGKREMRVRETGAGNRSWNWTRHCP